jgi:hypothetical protein
MNCEKRSALLGLGIGEEVGAEVAVFVVVVFVEPAVVVAAGLAGAEPVLAGVAGEAAGGTSPPRPPRLPRPIL